MASDRDAIAAIQRKYRVQVTPGADGVCLEFADVPEKFNLSTARNEFTISTDTWHEHFDDLGKLQAFLDGLFSGRLRVVVKYRGKTPVGHQVQLVTEGKTKVVSFAGSLLPLFWLPKSYRTLRYAVPNKPDEPSA